MEVPARKTSVSAVSVVNGSSTNLVTLGLAGPEYSGLRVMVTAPLVLND